MEWELEKIEDCPYTALRNVPLVSTGIDYEVKSHPQGLTISEEMLADAVAATGDPAITAPRLKIGHHDDRFDSPDFDGEPAVGRIENIRLGDNDQTVYGDIITFDWLAEIIPLAYPSRSIEAGMNVQPMYIENHETVTGKKYRMVLTGLSLLGIVWPGCSTLDDLQLLSTGEGVTVQAAMNIEDVRSAYYEELGSDRPNWWIRGMRLNPNELVVDDDDGHLYRVPFKFKGDVVKFEDPVQVVVDYKDIPESVAAGIFTEGLLGGRQQDTVLYVSRAESRPESEQGGQMDRTALCASLGLEASASDEEIREKLTAGGIALASTGEEEQPAPEGENGNGDDTEEEGTTEEAGTEASLPRTVNVEASVFEQMRSDAALAREMHTRNVALENDGIIRDAIRAGKFAPAVAASVRKQLENPATRESAVQWIAELETGIVPTTPVGTGAAGDEVDAEKPNEGLPWFTREHDRAQKIAAGTHVTMAGDN